MSKITPPIDALKQQAKSLRTALERKGQPISHSTALELVAQQHGFRDWNTAYASAGNTPPIPFQIGQRVQGRYLNQPFNGEIIGAQRHTDGSHYDLTLRFDDAVDVITFDSMSNFRKQVRATVDTTGKSPAKTSDGTPHLILT